MSRYFDHALIIHGFDNALSDLRIIPFSTDTYLGTDYILGTPLGNDLDNGEDNG
jgi:hypothetical protein